MKYVPTESLSIHPLIADLPSWEDDSDEFRNLILDIDEHGIIQPLVITGGNLIVDGRHRWRAAVQAGIVEVPVVMVDEIDAAEIALATITQRRHYTKGALAYLCYPIIAAAAASHGGDRRSKSTESTLIAEAGDPKSKSTESTLKTADLCHRAGFGRDLYFQAQKIHDVFDRRPDLKAQFEPHILTGAIGLGAALAGLAGKEATAGVPRRDREPEQLLFTSLDTLAVRFERWEKLQPPARRAVIERTVGTVLSLPKELQVAVLKALRAQSLTPAS